MLISRLGRLVKARSGDSRGVHRESDSQVPVEDDMGRGAVRVAESRWKTVLARRGHLHGTHLLVSNDGPKVKAPQKQPAL